MKDLASTFMLLSGLLRKHAQGLSIRTDEPGNLYVELPSASPKEKPAFFGAVQMKKSYVSYHLMPVYSNPGLLDGISAELKSRMQGKSCFNFKQVDTGLFEELDTLTKVCRKAVS